MGLRVKILFPIYQFAYRVFELLGLQKKKKKKEGDSPHLGTGRNEKEEYVIKNGAISESRRAVTDS